MHIVRETFKSPHTFGSVEIGSFFESGDGVLLKVSDSDAFDCRNHRLVDLQPSLVVHELAAKVVVTGYK